SGPGGTGTPEPTEFGIVFEVMAMVTWSRRPVRLPRGVDGTRDGATMGLCLGYPRIHSIPLPLSEPAGTAGSDEGEDAHREAVARGAGQWAPAVKSSCGLRRMGGWRRGWRFARHRTENKPADLDPPLFGRPLFVLFEAEALDF